MPYHAPLRLLLIQEKAADAPSINAVLAGEPTWNVVCIDQLADALAYLSNNPPTDVILLNLGLPKPEHRVNLERLLRDFSRYPVIVLVDEGNDAFVLTLVEAGAHDCFGKDQLREGELVRAIRLAAIRSTKERRRLWLEFNQPIPGIGNRDGETTPRQPPPRPRERVKELRGIHHAAMVLRDDNLPLPELLREFALILPLTAPFPDLAVARVVVGQHVAETPYYRDTRWTLESRFETSTGTVGSLRIAYVDDGPLGMDASVLEEEQRMLDSLAELLRSRVESREALARLRESESQFRVLFEHNPHPMWVFDLRTLEFLAVNDTAVAHYGYAREEFLAMRITDIRPEEDVPALLANIARKAEDYQYDQMWRHRLKNGRIIRAEIHSKAMTFDGREARLVLALDCTKRIVAEEALQASEASLRRAQRIASIGSWEYDFVLDKFRWSDEVYRLFGIAREELVPKDAGWLGHVHPDDRRRFIELWTASREHQHPIDFEYRLIRPDGRILHVHQRGELACDSSGRVVRAEGTIQDITERVELLAREQAARREADRASQYYRSLFECAPGCYLVLTPIDFEIVAVSDAYLRATMTVREEVFGKKLFAVLPDDPECPNTDGAQRLRESLERVQQTGRTDVMAVQRFPIRRPADQGGGFETRYWSPVNSPVLGPHGELAFIIHRVEDVTDYLHHRQQSGEGPQARRELASRTELLEADIVLRSREIQQANERLAQSQRMLRMASSLSKVGGWRISIPDFEVTWTEETRLIHERDEEHPPKLEETLNFYAAEDRERIRSAFTRCAEKGVSFDEECQMITARKRSIWVRAIGEVRWTPIVGQKLGLFKV